NLKLLGDEELEALRGWIELHKTHRPLLHHGRVVRQTYPDPGAVASMIVDDQGALASLAQLEAPLYASPEPLRLEGLGPYVDYRGRLLNITRGGMKHAPALARGETATASGQIIERTGIPTPILRPGGVAVFHLERVDR